MKLKKYLSLVKFSHTVFALPFAIIGVFLAFSETNNFEVYKLVFVILCMIFARNAAMAFNRLIDFEYDLKNPRTSQREIPSGQITKKSARAFVIINSVLFIAACYFINNLVFYLSPIALIVVLVYSYTKRFTWFCHIVLGMGLALAPIGAYLTVTSYFNIIPLILSFAVLFWSAGFDIIYSLQDENFDKSLNLKSIPSKFGYTKALNISRIFHSLTLILLFTFGILVSKSYFFWIGFAFFAIMLFNQHRIVYKSKLENINMAFFVSNGIASIFFCVFTLLDIFNSNF